MASDDLESSENGREKMQLVNRATATASWATSATAAAVSALCLVVASFFGRRSASDFDGSAVANAFWVFLLLFAITLLVAALVAGRRIGLNQTSAVAPMAMMASVWLIIMAFFAIVIAGGIEQPQAGQIILTALIVGAASFVILVVSIVRMLSTLKA